MRRAPILALGLLVGLSAVACGVLGDEAETQEAAHTEGDPTFAQHDWLWADETEDEFKKNAVDNGSFWMGPAEFLPLDHPMTQRLQFWIDRMDDVLRNAYPEKLKGTPKPKLIIRKSPEANAWVTAIPVTWKVKTRLLGNTIDAGTRSLDAAADGTADAGTDADVDAAAAAPPPPPIAPSLLLRRNATIERGPATAFEREFTPAKGEAFASFFTENFSRCRVSIREREMTFSEDCLAKSVREREGEKVSFYATAKYVTFTTGYIAQLLDEDRIISTLAHELGHYYRSHTNVPTDVVNYFYSLDTAHAHKPPPDPRYLDQTTKARQKLREGGWGVSWDEENALMRDRRLGFYTTEQEADEIALELMSKIGVPPGVAVDKVLNMLKNFGGDGIGWTECSMLRDHGWKDAEGKDVSVPVGDPDNAHHNLCFRAFNMSREINAHRYQPAARPNPPGDDWARLLSRMLTEIDPPPPPPPATDAGTSADAAPADAGTD